MIGPLAACLLLPLCGAGLCVSLPRQRHARWLALLASAFTLAVGASALVSFARAPSAEFRLLESFAWSREFGASFAFGVDAFGAAMLALSGLITAIATLAAFADPRAGRSYHALVLVLLAAVNGVFVALDLLLFYVCWEAVLLPMLPLIGLFGGEQRRYAALKFCVYTLAGSVLMLAMLLALWSAIPAGGRDVAVAPATLAAHASADGLRVYDLPLVTAAGAEAAVVHVPRDFDLRHLALHADLFARTPFLGWTLAGFGFLAVLIASLVKLPSVPFHTWLPHAHVQAPTAVSVLLAGVLLKLGVFGLYRVGLPLFPSTAAAWTPQLCALGVVGILWGAYAALGQRDLKRLVAYSSVSHMGFCLLGLASLTTAGALGAMLQSIAHGLSSPLLFLLVGVVYDRAHHRRVDGFGGLAAPMPRFCWLLLLAALAGCALPGLVGFVGEFTVLTGAFTGRGWAPTGAALATLASVVSAGYFLWMVQRVAFGPVRHKEQAAFADVGKRELWAIAPLAALVVLFGVWPTALAQALRPAGEALLGQWLGAPP